MASIHAVDSSLCEAAIRAVDSSLFTLFIGTADRAAIAHLKPGDIVTFCADAVTVGITLREGY